MFKAVFLDMDDCLIVKQALFDKAQSKLFKYISYFGFSVEDVSKKFDDVDTEMFKTHGFANDVFNSAVQLKSGVLDSGS